MTNQTLLDAGLLVTPFEIAHMLAHAGAAGSSISRSLQLDEADPTYTGVGAASLSARAQSLGDPGEREAFEKLIDDAGRILGGLTISARLLVDDIDARRHLVIGTDGLETVVFEVASEGWLSLMVGCDASAVRAAALAARHGFVLISTSRDGTETGAAWDGAENVASRIGQGAWTTAAAPSDVARNALDIALAALFPSSKVSG